MKNRNFAKSSRHSISNTKNYLYALNYLLAFGQRELSKWEVSPFFLIRKEGLGNSGWVWAEDSKYSKIWVTCNDIMVVSSLNNLN